MDGKFDTTDPRMADPGFWRQAAEELKQASDAAWSGHLAGERLHERERGPLYLPVHPQGGEDNWQELQEVYGYLIGMAIELAALALSASLDSRLLERPRPTHHIIDLIDDLDVPLTETQRQLLRRIETALQWRRRAHAQVDDTELRMAITRHSTTSRWSAAEKMELDRVYGALTGSEESGNHPPAR